MTAPDDDHPLASTGALIARAQAGDQAARAEILLRYREPLARFLHGRLAPNARGALDTEDLVQETLAAVAQALTHLEYRGLGSFWGYVRRVGINLLLQEQRKQGAPGLGGDSTHSDRVPAIRDEAPLESLLHKENQMAVEAALENLEEPARTALLLRLELGLPYRIVARECGYSSADAARMSIGRTLAALASALSALRP